MNKVQGFFICKSKRSYQASVCTDNRLTMTKFVKRFLFWKHHSQFEHGVVRASDH